MEAKRVLLVLDRLVHHSTNGNDCEQSLAGLRRLLNGRTVSELLMVRPSSSSSSYEDDLIEMYRNELYELRESEREKQAEIDQLRRQVARLQQNARDDEPVNGFYTQVQINALILTKFGKLHGIKKALVEKNQERRRHDPSLPKISDGMLQQWRRDNRYPAFVVEQLKLLSPDDLLAKHPWTADEMAFFVELYNTNPHLSNQELAIRCTKQFGRHITDCAIRGALTRARAAKMADYRNTYT